MDKKDALRVLFQCAELYQQNLEGQNVLLICASNSLNRVDSVELQFERTSFMHLTGVKFRDGERMPPDTFYTLCTQKRLSVDDFCLAEDGTTEMKLAVLPSLFGSKYLSANMIGDFTNRHPALFTEKLAGNERACVGFTFDKGLGCYAPNTVLKLDMRDEISNRQRIIAAYRKRKDDVQYSELVYKAKKVEWTKVKYPEAFAYIQVPTGCLVPT